MCPDSKCRHSERFASNPHLARFIDCVSSEDVDARSALFFRHLMTPTVSVRSSHSCHLLRPADRPIETDESPAHT
jgi:hypothetical protein